MVDGEERFWLTDKEDFGGFGLKPLTEKEDFGVRQGEEEEKVEKEEKEGFWLMEKEDFHVREGKRKKKVF